jgi:hypothetical protein
VNTPDEWFKASDSALGQASYGGRLHLARMTPADDGESLRLAFKSNEHAPWVIEYFVRPWRGRPPEQHDIDSIARQIDSEAATWFERKPRRKLRR